MDAGAQDDYVPHGWQDFDSDIVQGYYARNPDCIDRAATGGMRSPFRVDGGRRLAWRDGDYRKGTEYFGCPAIQLRVSPTYIYRDPLSNFITGRALVDRLMHANLGKAETHRLGYENSEDALTWNVFRGLQEAQRLRLAAEMLGGLECPEEPELYLWGLRIADEAILPWERLQAVRNVIEPANRQQTEPDICLHLPGRWWLLIEAKLSSPTHTCKGQPDKPARWVDHYGARSALFDRGAICAVDPAQFPDQLLRNMAFAESLASDGEQAVVAALVRRKADGEVEDWVRRCLRSDCRQEFRRATWEDLHAASLEHEGLGRICRYMASKSVGLLPAFDLDGG